MKTAKHLFKDPSIFGLNLFELASLVVGFGFLCSLFPQHPIVTGVFAVFSYIIILLVKRFLGYFNLIRLPDVLFNKKSKVSNNVVCYKLIAPSYSDLVFEQFDQYLNNVKSFLSFVDYPVSVQFVRRQLDVDKVYKRNKQESLSVERSNCYQSNFTPFANELYFFVNKDANTKFLQACGSVGWIIKKQEYSPLLNFNGFRKSNKIFRKNEIIHNFEFRELLEEFRPKDLSDFLRKSPHEHVLTMYINKEPRSKHIRKLNLRYQRLKKLQQGQASTTIERNLSLENSLSTLEGLIRGNEDIFSLRSVISFKQNCGNEFSLPNGVFSSSFKKTYFLNPKTIKTFHEGSLESTRFLPIHITGSDLAKVLPLNLNLYQGIRSKEGRCNFTSTYNEPLYISGFQDRYIPNGNAVVFGQSGKGKSFLCAHLFSSLIEQDTSTDIVIIDTGLGFNGFTKAFGGQSFNMSVEQKEDSGLNFIEFLKLCPEKSQQVEHLFNFTKLLLNQKLKSAESSSLSIKQSSVLRDLCSNYDIGQSKGINDFYHYLQKEDQENLLEDVVLSLKPFCRGGHYGHHFDGELKLNGLKSRVLYFTSPAVASVSDNPLVLPYFFVVNTLISIRSSLLNGNHRKVIVLWDEVASLMEIAPEVVSSGVGP